MPFLIPLAVGGAALFGLGSAGGFVTGSATSKTLGTGISIASVVVGLFLVLILMKNKKLLGF